MSKRKEIYFTVAGFTVAGVLLLGLLRILDHVFAVPHDLLAIAGIAFAFFGGSVAFIRVLMLAGFLDD